MWLPLVQPSGGEVDSLRGRLWACGRIHAIVRHSPAGQDGLGWDATLQPVPIPQAVLNEQRDGRGAGIDASKRKRILRKGAKVELKPVSRSRKGRIHVAHRVVAVAASAVDLAVARRRAVNTGTHVAQWPRRAAERRAVLARQIRDRLVNPRVHMEGVIAWLEACADANGESRCVRQTAQVHHIAAVASNGREEVDIAVCQGANHQSRREI